MTVHRKQVFGADEIRAQDDSIEAVSRLGEHVESAPVVAGAVQTPPIQIDGTTSFDGLPACVQELQWFEIGPDLARQVQFFHEPAGDPVPCLAPGIKEGDGRKGSS